MVVYIISHKYPILFPRGGSFFHYTTDSRLGHPTDFGQCNYSIGALHDFQAEVLRANGWFTGLPTPPPSRKQPTASAWSQSKDKMGQSHSQHTIDIQQKQDKQPWFISFGALQGFVIEALS